MKDGIYYVRFLSNGQGVGEGIAVMKGESVNGGDSGYTYTGYKQVSADGFVATLTIRRWDPNSQSVFGPLNEFKLEFRGAATDDGFQATGSIVGELGMTLNVRGQFLTAAN